MAGSSKSVVRYCGPRSMFRCKLTNNAPLAKNCTPEIVPSPARTRRGSAVSATRSSCRSQICKVGPW